MISVWFEAASKSILVFYESTTMFNQSILAHLLVLLTM